MWLGENFSFIFFIIEIWIDSLPNVSWLQANNLMCALIVSSSQLSDPAKATIYKFRAPSVSAAKSWISNLQQALSENTQLPPDSLENLMTFE